MDGLIHYESLPFDITMTSALSLQSSVSIWSHGLPAFEIHSDPKTHITHFAGEWCRGDLRLRIGLRILRQRYG